MPTYIPLPIEKTSSKLADWLEINALLDNDCSASSQDLRYTLNREAEPEDDQIDTGDVDEEVTKVLNEIENRILSAGDGYPFKLEHGEKIKKKSTGQEFLPYVFCLLISYLGSKNSKVANLWTVNAVAKKFEELSKLSAEKFLKDEKTELIVEVFGYPRNWRGRCANPRFIKALKDICKRSGEMIYVKRISAATAKDGGLDIVAWKKFPDMLRTGFIFVGQCGVGQNWSDKLHELGDFLKWFVSDRSQAIQAIFIPHLPEELREEEEWLENTLKSGMIFNRCRIAFLATDWQDQEILQFCREVLQKLRTGINRSKKY